MRHYWIEKGTEIVRWNGHLWRAVVTTKDVYYTDKDVYYADRYTTKDAPVPGDSNFATRFMVPDLAYPMISVTNDKLRRICDKCGCAIGKSPYYRCLVCRGEIEP